MNCTTYIPPAKKSLGKNCKKKKKLKKGLLYYWTLSQKSKYIFIIAGVLLNCEIHGLLIRVLGPSAGLINPSGEHVFDLLLVSHIYLQKHFTHNYNIYKTLFLSCKMYSLLVRCSDSKAQPIYIGNIMKTHLI